MEWRIAINFSKSTAIILALHPAQSSNIFRGTNPMGRNNTLSVDDPRYITYLFASHRSGEEENCSKKSMLGHLLNRRNDLSIRK